MAVILCWHHYVKSESWWNMIDLWRSFKWATISKLRNNLHASNVRIGDARAGREIKTKHVSDVKGPTTWHAWSKHILQHAKYLVIIFNLLSYIDNKFVYDRCVLPLERDVEPAVELLVIRDAMTFNAWVLWPGASGPETIFTNNLDLRLDLRLDLHPDRVSLETRFGCKSRRILKGNSSRLG